MKLNMWQRGISLLVGLILATFNLSAQKVDKKEAGVRITYGVINEDLPEGSTYKPVLFLPYLNYYFTKAERRARFSGVLEQQVGIARVDFKESNRVDHEWEFGLNAGPEFSYRFNWFKPYVGAMYGIDLITVDTELQENGWILAATAYTGIKVELNNNIYGDIHARARHISNGGLKDPNLGIDTFFLGAGISKMY